MFLIKFLTQEKGSSEIIQTYIKEHGSWILLKYTESEKRFCKEYFNGKYRNLKVGLQVSR